MPEVDARTVTREIEEKYPNQYYCTLDKPCGWYNMWVYSSDDGLPPLSALYPMTSAEWAAKGGDSGTRSMAVIDGKLQDYTAPAPVVPLPTQAQAAQAWVQQQANLAAASGRVFSAAMNAYVDQIEAIANGQDTTSTTLPQQPGASSIFSAKSSTSTTG